MLNCVSLPMLTNLYPPPPLSLSLQRKPRDVSVLQNLQAVHAASVALKQAQHNKSHIVSMATSDSSQGASIRPISFPPGLDPCRSPRWFCIPHSTTNVRFKPDDDATTSSGCDGHCWQRQLSTHYLSRHTGHLCRSLDHSDSLQLKCHGSSNERFEECPAI